MSDKGMDLDSLQELLWSFAAHRVLTVAGRVGILGVLATETVTPDGLAKRLNLDPFATGKIVRALSALGVVEPKGSGYRVVEPLAEPFTPEANDMVPFLEHSHDLYERWGQNLEPWLRGEQWTTKHRDSAGIKRFGAAMQAMAGQIAKQVVPLIDLRGVDRMLDLGGGTGTYARVFCEAVPRLRAVVIDRPEVAEIGRNGLADTDLADRIEFVAGDYFDTDCGSDFDLVLIANVLHQERPQQAAALISRAAAATGAGGRVAIIDFAIDEHRHDTVVGALFAINMRSFGDTYNESTIREWMANAGLTAIQCSRLGSTRWLITGHKPI